MPLSPHALPPPTAAIPPPPPSTSFSFSMTAFLPSPPIFRTRPFPSALSHRHSHPRSNFPRNPSPPSLSLDLSPTPQPQSPPTPFNPSTSALREAILSVAVGKLGTKPIPTHLFPALYNELTLASRSPPTKEHLPLHLLRSSLLGTLYVKANHTPEELALLSFATNTTTFPTPHQLVAAIGYQHPYIAPTLYHFALSLLQGHRLTRERATELGSLLYAVESDAVGTWPLRVLIAHIMRVRHENADELTGLAIAASRTLKEDWGGESDGEPYVHIAEPFDGVLGSDLLTPLLCKRLKDVYGMKPVMAVGRSAGPKYGPNLRDVVSGLGVTMCRSGKQVTESGGEFGVAVDQGDCSPGLDGWVDVRRIVVKRPSVATTEKYVDCAPGGSRLFVGSAFHGGYVELMATAAEGVGFGGYIIVGKGMEGTVGLGVGEKRKAELLVGWAKEGGGYGREVVEFNVVRDGNGGGDVGEGMKRGDAEVGVMVERIKRFAAEGSSGNRMFDARVEATYRAFDKALKVLRREAADVVGEVDLKQLLAKDVDLEEEMGGAR